MAQEITGSVNVTITLNSQTVSGITTFRGDLAGDYVGEEQTIGTTAVALDFGDMTSIRCLYVRNLDATNFVQVDSSNAFTSFPQKLLAGDSCVLFPQTTTVYAKANTAPVKVFLVAG